MDILRILLIIWGVISIYSLCISKWMIHILTKDEVFLKRVSKKIYMPKDEIISNLKTFNLVDVKCNLIPLYHIPFTLSFTVIIVLFYCNKDAYRKMTLKVFNDIEIN